MTSECVIAVDVGGTAIKAALVGDQGQVLHSHCVPTDQAGGADGVIDQIATIVTDLESVAARSGWNPLAVGVAVLGLVDDEAGVAVLSANLGWRDVPIRRLLEKRIRLPLAFGHDVRAGGLAEAVLGAGRGAGDHLFLAIGTGVAGALMIGGMPYVGSGYAGEIGHVVVDPDGRVCGCGGRGCLETVASASAIARAYGDSTGETVAAAEVAARAAAGDEVAERIWARAVDALAVGLAVYVSLLAPPLVVIGGGLATSGDQLLVPLRRRLAEVLSFQRQPEIVPARLGDQAGCLGAGLLAWLALGREVSPS